MAQIYYARDFSEEKEFECESCNGTYGEAYVIAGSKEEAREMVESGEVLCSTCVVEMIMEGYTLKPLSMG
jgi:hypothetical protein